MRFLKSLFILTATIFLSGQFTYAQDLNELGLGSLQVADDAVGDEVRGLSASAGYSGLSMVSGFLIDPATNSTARVSVINQTNSLGDGMSDANASGQTVAAMDYAWTINGLAARMAGFAQGAGLSFVVGR